MERYATVADPGTGPGPVLVYPERNASCGSCRACLGAGGQVEPITVTSDIAVRQGDRVLLSSATGTAVLQILKLFFLPLAGFWGAFGLATLIPGAGELPAAAAGCAGFLLVFFLIRLDERRKGARGRSFYRITARVSVTPPGP